jgi:hypothetical protein
MSQNIDFLEDKNLPSPATFPKNASAELIQNLQAISEVFQKIEEETAKMAELIFDYLINVSDEQIMTGKIPPHKNKRIDSYVKILNRLFLLSRNSYKGSGFKIISRSMVKNLDRKAFAICMCYDGGVSLDVLCDIVNAENEARTPKTQVRVIVSQNLSTASFHELIK